MTRKSNDDKRLIDANEVMEFMYSEMSGKEEQIQEWIEECGLSDLELFVSEDFPVDVEDALKELCEKVIDGVANVIESAETIDPDSTGEWIPLEYNVYADGYLVWDKWECSKCGNEINGEDTPVYCCDCGAKNRRRLYENRKI